MPDDDDPLDEAPPEPLDEAPPEPLGDLPDDPLDEAPPLLAAPEDELWE